MGMATYSRAMRLSKVWALATGALLAIYASHELLASLPAAGEPLRLSEVFGSGAWVALALAVALGGLLALALRGADALLRYVAARRRPRADRWPRIRRLRAPRRRFKRSRPLASLAAGRAPPARLPLT